MGDGASGVEFRLLGAFEVTGGGRPVEIGSPKQRALLAMLVVHRGRAVTADELAEELWEGHPPASVASTLPSVVSRVRRALAAGAGPGGVNLRAVGAGYRLDLPDAAVDAARFEGLVRQAREAVAGGAPHRAGEHLRAALALWRGPALTEFADRPFARIEAARLDGARCDAVELLVDLELGAGRATEALALLEPHVAEHPLREGAWGQTMLALYRLGRQAEALRAFQTLRRLLGEELGVEPTPALRRLEEQILRHDPNLDPDRPDGETTETLAFLFSDIEASTPRWEADRDGMAVDLARHDNILGVAVEAHHGRRFAHTGDGMAAAFTSASDALAAALSAQRALLAETWKSVEPLRVRMAVHAGLAERRAGNFFGPTLNRAARLLALAAGGQVICSAAVAELIQDDLPPDVSLFPLGDHRLGGLARPELVYQVLHPDLPAPTGPAAASLAAGHNLPVALTPFIGRSAELADLERVVPATRLLTLTGLGGAGKTRLGLELAARAQPHFPDGVWLVELSRLTDPTLVAAEVLAALGIQAGGLGAGTTPPIDRLCTFLADRRLLLVLDNCEHLVEAVADLVNTVLSRCPTPALLATSREVLGLPGEVAWPVPGLGLPAAGVDSPDDLAASDAVALFCARAGTAQPGFGLSAANVAPVAQICRRLDGIPLALELAAARIRVLGAHQVAAALDDRFRLLTGGARTTVARHQTLRAAMDWSYEMLPPAEQALLRQLCVFPQSFDLEAAAAVAGDRAPEPGFAVLDLLTRLVDKSLVSVEQAVGLARYRLLETVRQYAAEKLAEAGEHDAAHRAHRDYFLGVAGAVEGPSIDWFSGWWVPRVHVDHDNFLAAYQWSLAQDDVAAYRNLGAALVPYWFWAGWSADAFGRMEPTLVAPEEPTPSALKVFCAHSIALLESGRSDMPTAAVLVRRAYDIAATMDDPQAAAFAHYFLGCIPNMTGEGKDEGRRLLSEGLRRYEQLGSALGIGWLCYELSSNPSDAGVAESRAHLERAIHLDQQDGADALLRPHLLAALAIMTALSGEPDRAGELADEAVAAARDGPLRGILVMALVRAAQAAAFSGRWADAVSVLRELLGLLRDLSAQRWVAEALEAAALVFEGSGEDAAAARLLGAAGGLRGDFGELLEGRPALAERVQGCRDRIVARLGQPLAEAEERAGRSLETAAVLAMAVSEVGHLGP